MEPEEATNIYYTESSRVYGDELEDYFDSYFSEEFNTEAGDGSSRQVHILSHLTSLLAFVTHNLHRHFPLSFFSTLQVADLLIEVHKECALGNLDRVNTLLGTTQPVSSVSQSRRDVRYPSYPRFSLSTLYFPSLSLSPPLSFPSFFPLFLFPLVFAIKTK